MEGRIYISGAFTNIKYNKCKPNSKCIDNDPHFWSIPPTWGICRYDFRNRVNPDDYIFFVLPTTAELPQMIYAYMQIEEIITHEEAYNRLELKNKRMKGANPDGNIIVDYLGKYTHYDGGAHKDKFEIIKQRYAIGNTRNSRMLSAKEIQKKSSSFVSILNLIFDCNKLTPFEIISRKGDAEKYR